ncbi:polynucleotidyl transferase, ribonuclease H-like superfamily protein [Wolffia australiana]
MAKLSILRSLFSTVTGSPSGAVGVKKVTKSNFLSALEELRSLVRDAEFVAVDLEMSGVTSAPWREAFEFDRSDVRYLKVKDSAEKFAIVQFGVCPFRWDSSKDSFVAHPFNFFIFPRTEVSTAGPSDEFHCQTSSISFLARHQFDFNACIYEGISYLSRAQEALALDSAGTEINRKCSDAMINEGECYKMPLGRTSDILFTERMRISLHEWRNSILTSPGGNGSEGGSSSFKSQFQTSFFKMRPAITLKGFGSHQQKLIRMVIRRNFDDLVYVSAPGDVGEEKKVIYAASKEDKGFLMQDLRNDLVNMSKEKLAHAVGFRQVIDLLSSEEKLLVGHNCFLDFAQMYSKFVRPLPPSITEFSSELHKNFANITDTRYLLKAIPVIRQLMKKSSSSLSSAFSILCPHISQGSHGTSLASSVLVKVEVEANDNGSCTGAKHEAGYDAFMTGCVFAQACCHLGIDFKHLSASSSLIQNPNLQKYINLLYPNWNGGVVINLLTGEEMPDSSGQLFKWRYPKMIFDNTVIIWGFPFSIKPRELRECLNRALGQDSVVSIFYIDSTSALVQFSSPVLASEFLATKEDLERRDDAIRVLHPLSRLLDGGKTGAGRYDIYKDLCCSPIAKPSIAEQAEAMGITKGLKKKNKEEHASASVTENSKEYSNQIWGDPHNISCGDILNSLCASHAMVGR